MASISLLFNPEKYHQKMLNQLEKLEKIFVLIKRSLFYEILLFFCCSEKKLNSKNVKHKTKATWKFFSSHIRMNKKFSLHAYRLRNFDNTFRKQFFTLTSEVGNLLCRKLLENRFPAFLHHVSCLSWFVGLRLKALSHAIARWTWALTPRNLQSMMTWMPLKTNKA